MGRLFNKFVRSILKKLANTGLEQELQSGSGGEMAYPEMADAARQAAAEGIVLLKNERELLPLRAGEPVAVFGRVAIDYFAVGYGSGGDTRAPYITNLYQGLDEDGVCYDKELFHIYDEWTKKPKNVPDEGFWGHWPMSFPEMPLTEDVVSAAAGRCKKALVVIGRAAGEDRENVLKPGSYYLTKQEKQMLSLVTSHFSEVAVIMDCGNLIDMGWLQEYGDSVGAVLYAWQGGMESGRALADVLCGKVNPSGRLTDTIAVSYDKYPSASSFGDKEANAYEEDIYVGYRYFETFAKSEVLYPFGYGLSYTTFSMEHFCSIEGHTFHVRTKVTNTGNRPGKEVVQWYIEAPQGKLGKAARVLAAFDKTKELQPQESQELTVSIPLEDAASYDDGGVTGARWSYVLEEGAYVLYGGGNVRDAIAMAKIEVDELIVVEKLQEAAAPDPAYGFLRMVNENGRPVKKPVPTRTTDLRRRILEHLPKELPRTEDKPIRLEEVASGDKTLDAFVAQLTPEECNVLAHGEGKMNSALGVPGNAGAFGGVSQGLRDKGIPPMITTDGPSGIRIFRTVALLPCGTALASTFHTKLVERLYAMVGREMKHHGSDILLAPGMNIHRNPLCGRNFEYYSEDPYLTGQMAAAVVSGIQSMGVSACPKHFACNNQETRRNTNDSRVSERALREIYLKGFSIVVKNACPDTIMTSYNKVNGVWSHYHYDLVTRILREEWGYQGMVMTDWWMQPSSSPEFPSLRDDAYRVRAQVDVLMPGAPQRSRDGAIETSLLETYQQKDGITLGELQRTAKNVLMLILKRKFKDPENERTNRPAGLL